MRQKIVAMLAGVVSVFSLSSIASTVLRDDFSNARSGWPNMAATRSGDLGLAVYTDSGKYQMTPVQDEVFGFVPAPKQANGDDVKLSADLFLYAGLGAGAGGLGCRHQDHRNFYAFTMRGDAVVAILKVKQGKVSVLAQGKVKSIMPGTVDTRLSVECKGDRLSMSVKDGSRLSAQDGDFRSGNSGVFVIGQKLAGTSLQIDNFELEELSRP